MRVMEAGLDEFGVHVGAPKRDNRNWHVLINDIKKQLENRNDLNKQQRNQYKEVLARIEIVKDVWRNPTIRVEKKYNQEECGEIFGAVKRFMEILCNGAKRFLW